MVVILFWTQSFIQCYLFFFFPFRSSAWLRPWRSVFHPMLFIFLLPLQVLSMVAAMAFSLSSNVIYFSSSPSGPQHGCGHGVQSFIQCYLFFFFPFRSSAWLRPWRSVFHPMLFIFLLPLQVLSMVAAMAFSLSSNVIYFSSSPSGPRHGCGHGVQSFIQCYLFFFFPFRSSAWLRPWRYFAASGVKSITTSIGPLQTLTSTSHPSLSTHGKTPSSEEPVHHVPESNEGLYEDIFSYLETFIWF